MWPSSALGSGEAEVQPSYSGSCLSWWDANFKPESLFSQEMATPHAATGLFEITQSTLLTHVGLWSHANSGHPSCLWVQKLRLPCAFCHYSCWDLFIFFFCKLGQRKWVVLFLKITWTKIRNKITSVTNESSILYLTTESTPSSVRKTSEAWKVASLPGQILWGQMMKLSFESGYPYFKVACCYTANSVRT